MAFFLIYGRELAKLPTIISSQTILFSDFLAQSSFLFSMFFAHPFMHQKYQHPPIHLLSVTHTCMLTSLFLLFLVPSPDIILVFHIYFMYSFVLFDFSCLLVVIIVISLHAWSLFCFKSPLSPSFTKCGWSLWFGWMVLWRKKRDEQENGELFYGLANG